MLHTCHDVERFPNGLWENAPHETTPRAFVPPRSIPTVHQGCTHGDDSERGANSWSTQRRRAALFCCSALRMRIVFAYGA
jgi:hypothetical protein